MENEKIEKKQKKQPYWLIYIALLLAGIVLITDAYQVTQLQKWTARMGVAMIYSAFALVVGRGHPSGIIATIIICLAVLLTFVF